jgi:peroxiredoxin
MFRLLVSFVGFAFAAFVLSRAPAQEARPAVPSETNPKAGHSYHGEAFNEGPRQAAYLMPGMGNIRFEITTKDPRTQAFFTQGVCQLHSFWYFEAERSFRQAAFHDPNCAMAYWGMAMANVNNEKRSRDFIARAEKLRTGASRREQMWIDGWAAYVKSTAANNVRWRTYIRSLEAIGHEFPQEIEATAFLAWALWTGNTKGLPIGSHQAVDALIAEVLRENPMHPGAHHYRIHLWDGEKQPRALLASELYGPSSPGIAHAWHMQGHIYSGLRRFADAVYSQEASARVDHAYMIRDRVMPYQIHNFAHNNQWMITDLSYIGRARDAALCAANLVEIPRHPRQNRIEDAGSCARYGRARLLEVLTRWEMWDELIAYSTTVLDPTPLRDEQIKRLRALGAAYFETGNVLDGLTVIADLERLGKTAPPKADPAKLPPAAKATVDFKKDILPILTKNCFECHKGRTPPSGFRLDVRDEIVGKSLAVVGKSAESRLIHAVSAIGDSSAAMPAEGKALTTDEVGLLRAWIDQGMKWDDAAVAAETGVPDPKTGKTKGGAPTARKDGRSGGGGPTGSIGNALAELNGRYLAAVGDAKGAADQLAKVTDLRKEDLSRAYAAAGNRDQAEKTAKAAADAAKDQLHPQLNYVDVLERCGKADAAAAQLRIIAPKARDLDSDVPVARRLAKIAAAAKMPKDWNKVTPARPVDIHHPKISTLGPLTWSPSPAAEFSLSDMNGRAVSLSEFRGKPTIVLFYLGSGCEHCVEQLTKFAGAFDEFSRAGISVVAISLETPAEVKAACERPGAKAYPFPLLADPNKAAFKKWRVYDDFESQPLHGTFLVDAAGRVRWQDISFNPFMDTSYLLHESRRLLKL